jgi:ABC-2 type transport system ATP-binding protein
MTSPPGGAAWGDVGAGGTADGGAGPAVVVDGLVKRYGPRTVVDGVSLRVEAGELVALLGPNGAGKTTTVETIEGYRAPDGGLVRVLGVDPLRGGPALRARVGLMLQGGGVDPRARPRETLVQYGRFHTEPRDADELITSLGLETVQDTPFRRLSGGERQRLGLALALVGRPEVVVLDEPTAGMDPEARAIVRSLVMDLRDAGAAILMTSHDLSDVERLADRIVVIDKGRIVAQGTPASLAAGAAPRLRVRFDRPLDDADRAGLAGAITAGRPGATAVDDGGADRIRIEGVPPDPMLVEAVTRWSLEAGRLVAELRTGSGSLEDVYLDLVGRARGDGP